MESNGFFLFVFVFILSLTDANVYCASRSKMTDDASDVTWAHAVNSQRELDNALAGSIDFIEADISLGKVIGNEEAADAPIMAHPPDKTSDISLDTWLDTVVREKPDKGVKLDFKSIEVVEPSLNILQKYSSKLNSVWLNADVLPGPKNAPAIPVVADQFFALCHQYFPNATLSIGWTTYLLPLFGDDFPHYAWHHVREMADLIRCQRIEDNLFNYTFPVRAIFASRSIKQLQWLLSVVQNSTLTIWNGKYDPLELQDVLRIRESFPKQKVYYDLLHQMDKTFESKKNTVHGPVSDVMGDDGLWTTFTRGQGESCSTLTYVRNDVIVFGKSLTTAVLQKSVITLTEKDRLKVTGKINFFHTNQKHEKGVKDGTQKLSIFLAGVDFFSKAINSQNKLDLTTSDTEVIWSAINRSVIYTFNHDYAEEKSPCRFFKLDSSEDRTFQVWTVPCEQMLEDASSNDIPENGIPEISSRKRLVLPKGPFLLGFMSSGEEHVAIYDLKINYEGGNYQKDNISSGSISKLQASLAIISLFVSLIGL